MLVSAEVEHYKKSEHDSDLYKFNVEEEPCGMKSEMIPSKISNKAKIDKSNNDCKVKIERDLPIDLGDDDLDEEIKILFKNVEVMLEEKIENGTILTNTDNMYHKKKSNKCKYLKYFLCCSSDEQ